MRKKRFKLLAGMVVLSANLLFTGCGSKTSDTEEVVMESTEDTIEESTDNDVLQTIPASSTASEILAAAVENYDEFSEERAIFEHLVSNSEMIYTDEFKNLEDIYINWNAETNRYEIIAEKGETKFEINLEDANLLNFLIHQTSCKELIISHDKDEALLSSLTSCDTIKSIIINDCNIASIENISCLTNLENLTINNCQNITDLSPIENLTNLKTIAINGTRIADISVLANLKNLTNLNLKCNEITNPEALEALENLTVLSLQFNRISDVEKLSGLVASGLISEEEAMGIVESCEKHRLSFTTDNYQEEANVLYISYIDSKEAYFVELRNENQEMVAFALTPDSFDFYNISEDTPNCTGIKLTNIPSDFMHFSISDASKYDAMVIDHCDIDSLSFVDDFENLTYLSIENCPNLVDPFEWGSFNIYKMDHLKTLIVKGTSINNLDELKNFSALEEVEIRDNDVTDWGFLMYIPHLKIAFIGIDNYPVDARPLETIQEAGVYVKVTGYNLPPVDEYNNETLDGEELEEITDNQDKTLGKTPNQ